jgi:hypothetical protein
MSAYNQQNSGDCHTSFLDDRRPTSLTNDKEEPQDMFVVRTSNNAKSILTFFSPELEPQSTKQFGGIVTIEKKPQ